MLTQETLKRLDRALTAAAAGMMKIVASMSATASDGSTVFLWEIYSRQSNRNGRNGATYFVTRTAEWSCTCPDYSKRHKACKHILLAQLFHQQRVEEV